MPNRVTTILLSVLVLCATITTAAAVRTAFTPAGLPAARIRGVSEPVENWQKFLVSGHRTGPADAKVVILEFGDFECPACRSFTSGLRKVLAKYPRDVAVHFRHWPLSYHRFALPAARAAECAAAQGKFADMHYLLYDKQDSLGLKSFVSFALEAGVPDSITFSRCVAETGPIAALALDTLAVKEVGGRGTPTIVIGGIRLGTSPNAERLDSLVRRELERAGAIGAGSRG
jgi:protein-disulfide isomerase